MHVSPLTPRTAAAVLIPSPGMLDGFLAQETVHGVEKYNEIAQPQYPRGTLQPRGRGFGFV